MKKLQALKQAITKPDLAKWLKISPSLLTYTLYKLDDQAKYTEFKLPKKSGGYREIQAPTSKLKDIQSSLSKCLLDCLDEINSENFSKAEYAKSTAKNSKVLKIKCSGVPIKQPSLSHGFERHRSIITNAMMHLGKKMCLIRICRVSLKALILAVLEAFSLKTIILN